MTRILSWTGNGAHSKSRTTHTPKERKAGPRYAREPERTVSRRFKVMTAAMGFIVVALVGAGVYVTARPSGSASSRALCAAATTTVSDVTAIPPSISVGTPGALEVRYGELASQFTRITSGARTAAELAQVDSVRQGFVTLEGVARKSADTFSSAEAVMRRTPDNVAPGSVTTAATNVLSDWRTTSTQALAPIADDLRVTCNIVVPAGS